MVATRYLPLQAEVWPSTGQGIVYIKFESISKCDATLLHWDDVHRAKSRTTHSTYRTAHEVRLLMTLCTRLLVLVSVLQVSIRSYRDQVSSGPHAPKQRFLGRIAELAHPTPSSS